MTGPAVVRELAVAGFRSWGAVRLALDGRPVVVTGVNGAGKTNLIEAVSMLSPGRGLRGAGAEELVGRGREGWRIRALVETPDGPREIETEGAASGGRRVAIDGKGASQVALAGVLPVLWLTPALDRLWTDPPAERRRFVDRAAMSLVPGHAEAAMAYDRALRERNRLLRDGVTDLGWLAAIERQMAGPGARLAAGRRAAVASLEAAQEEGPFPRASLAMEGEAAGLDAADAAETLAATLAEGRRRDMAAGRTLAGPHRDDLAAIFAEKGVPARLCSTGEQKALVLSLSLASARAVARDAGAAPVLLLDEVVAHLDAGRRGDLFAALERLGAQVWMTGAEPDLFAAWGERAEWLLVTETDGASGLARMHAVR